ncbi:hypothetical protein ACJMK2_026118 [Sinanodonta woodiana]|uniref:Ig-like domain-containing protein n=1 Tax=Sinanodonta woodiana TaxID=1069815 RepID=A0ABD3XIK4_SINWO
MVGCDVSLTWMLPITINELRPVNIGSSYERTIATLSADLNCSVRDNSTMVCNMNISEDRPIAVLKIFNVTERQSGNYTLWKKTINQQQSSYPSKKLVVIGKPTIMEVRKPVLGLPFQMICNTTYEQGNYLYRWKINDTVRTTVNNINSHSISNLGMNHNFSNVTCQICFNPNASDLSSVTCENDGCSIDSDPYTIEVLYGPVNVSLSRGERHFYLKEHNIFTIDCFANCYPDCIFRWKGRNTIKSQKLNITFESRMAGQYSCHVTNHETNITLISDPIILHHAEEEFLSMGLVGVAVLLIVIGLLLLRQWRKNPSDKIDSKVLTELVVNLQTLTNGEISQGVSRIQNRLLPVPNTLEMSSRRGYRPRYLNQHRRSRSLHNLMDSTQNSFNPLQDSLSLQGLYYSSNTIERSLRNGSQSNGSMTKIHLSNCKENQLDEMSRLENGNNLEFLFSKVRNDTETTIDEHSADVESKIINKLQHITYEEDQQENLYNTID